MRPFDRIAQGLGLAVGLAAFSAPVAAEGRESPACLVDSVDSLSAADSSIHDGSNAFFLKLLHSDRESSNNLDPVCADDRLARLELRLMPGQTRSLILLIEAGVSVPLQVTEPAVTKDDEETGHWDVALRRVDAGADLQSVQLIELVVTAGTNNRRGQQRSFQLFADGNSDEGRQGLSLELNLESLDSERMFRDNFKVDPSVGQFSQRSQRSPGTAGYSR